MRPYFFDYVGGLRCVFGERARDGLLSRSADGLLHRSSAWTGLKRVATLALVGSVMLSPAAYAAPTGGQVTAGSGAISQTAGNTTVNQASQNLSLNWQTFNVGAHEAVNFVQPNAAAVAVNRIADTGAVRRNAHPVGTDANVAHLSDVGLALDWTGPDRWVGRVQVGDSRGGYAHHRGGSPLGARVGAVDQRVLGGGRVDRTPMAPTRGAATNAIVVVKRDRRHKYIRESCRYPSIMWISVNPVAAALVAAIFAKRGADYCADGSHKGCRYKNLRQGRLRFGIIRSWI